MPRKIYIWVLLFLWLCLAYPLHVHAKDAQIMDVLIQKNPHHLVIYAKVTNCFTKDMDTAILAGVPATFTFYVDFYQQRSMWFDRKISGLVVNHTIKYDHVKKTYYVSSSRTRDPSSFQDYQAAKEAMADLSGLEISPVGELKKDVPYYLKIKAKLNRVRLPLRMEYVFFFVSLWDFETDWHRENYRF